MVYPATKQKIKKVSLLIFFLYSLAIFFSSGGESSLFSIFFLSLYAGLVVSLISYFLLSLIVYIAVFVNSWFTHEEKKK
jgi:Flp pilus assembly protein TadB